MYSVEDTVFTNECKIKFKNLGPDARQIIVNALINRKLERYEEVLDRWVFVSNFIHMDRIYRTEPKPGLVLPWSVIQPRWQYAAMESNGANICLYTHKPRLSRDSWQCVEGIWEYLSSTNDIFIGMDDNKQVHWRESLTVRPK